MNIRAIWLSMLMLFVSTGAYAQTGGSADGGSTSIMMLFTLFVMACFVGFEIITKVPPTLHTPLMSGSNAMSGITIVGALMLTNLEGGDFAVAGINFDLAAALGMVALICATINVVGGFLVTDRMLKMFKKGD